MADDATDEPASVRMEDLVAKASPGGDFAARQVLANLEARLFNRRRDPVHVDRYIIERRLGAGGSGTVYCAYDPQKDRKVALKLLHAGDGARQKAAQARLFREAQTLTKINHTNVVKAYDVGTYDSSIFDPPGVAKKRDEPGVYVAMELIEGVTLDTWLRVEARTWRAIRDVFVQAGYGLAAAHAKGLIHRDFKPANVLVADPGGNEPPRAVVLDFGLARATDKQASSSHYGLAADAQERLKKAAAPIDATLTAPGTLLGTPAYMAPEQHARGRGTELSDQYALCLALYEAWYGHRPFFAETEQALEEAKLAEDVMPPPADTDVPEHLFRAVLKGMSAEPDDRHASMEVLIAALTTPPSRRARYLAAAAVGLVAAGGLAVWLARPADPCADDSDAFAEAWAPATAERITTAFAATERSFAASTTERVNARLGAHADAWREAWAQACVAEPEREPGPRRQCLEQRRMFIGALVEALATAPAPRLEFAASAATGLPSPDDCLSETLPWYVVGNDAADAATALVHAEARERTGDFETAEQRASDALASAKQLSNARAVGLAALRRGSVLGHTGRNSDAVEALADVVWSASGQHQRELASAAATRLVEMTMVMTTPHPDAPLWAQRARDAASKGRPVDRARTMTALGGSLVDTGQTDRGIEDLLAAEQLLAPLSDTPRVEHVRAAAARGRASLAAGQPNDAVAHLARAATFADDVFGPDHPQTGLALRELADAYDAAEMSEAATAERERADEILSAAQSGAEPGR